MVLSGMLIAALLAIGALGLWQGHQMSALLQTMYADRVVPLKQIKAVSDAYAVQIVDVVHKFADGSIDGQEALRQLDVAQGTIHSQWRAYTSTFLVPDEKQLIEKLTPFRDRVDATLPRLRQAFADNDRAFADQFRAGEMYPMFDAMQGVIGDLVNVQLSVSEQINAEAHALKQRSFWTSTASIALAIVAAMVLCASIIRHLMRSLGTEPTELKVIAQQVASGDLRPIQLQSAVPAGSVLQALVDMQGHLAALVSQIRDGSEGIATASTQIAMGNADLSQRTEEQASNLQQTAASMEQLSGTVRQSADTALQANQLASSAAQAAQQGGQLVEVVVHTMQDISTSSRRIADIIGVIDGIAFQTNILALNAAVEAARAGEQGRGFAVVASEVRSLASRSASAAKEIKSLINESVQKVVSGTDTVNQAGSAVKDIVDQVHQVSHMISQITGASSEQSQGIEQIGQAVQQLDLVTQQNAALVEETAAAAESLRHQAIGLVSLVSRFKTLQTA